MKRREILFLIISTFTLVVVWVGFSIYHNAVTSTISQALSIQITPISPTFDMQTFEKLKEREKVSPLFEIKKSLLLASPSASQSPTSSGIERATQSGSLLP